MTGRWRVPSGRYIRVRSALEVEINLNRRHLPRATYCILGLHGDLWTIKRRLPHLKRVLDSVQLQLCVTPLWPRPNHYLLPLIFRITSGEFEIEIIRP